ncbi:MAG TPA: antibiotic biosynthesis monooxygenase family protein [Lacisediminihabitans sp.]|uniref:putative quinol monooxygenase n=1 Tax=Lacisediminihabitans sp. TaxID=2787631 RepID=UPI002EDABA24
MFLVIATYTIAQGHESAVLELVRRLELASREEPGCISFDSYLKVGDDRALVLLERYESDRAFESHRATPHFRALVLEGIVPQLTDRRVETFTA